MPVRMRGLYPCDIRRGSYPFTGAAAAVGVGVLDLISFVFCGFKVKWKRWRKPRAWGKAREGGLGRWLWVSCAIAFGQGGMAVGAERARLVL